MNDFIIYKGCTNPVFIQLLNEDETPREYDSGMSVIFAVSPDRKKEHTVINQTMSYDVESGLYYLIVTPEMTDALSGDKKYYYDFKCVTENGIFPILPITPVWVVSDLAEVPDD